MSGIHGSVEVTDRAHAEKILPAVVLLEYLEQLVLLDHGWELPWIVDRRDAQQYAIVIQVESEEVYL